MKSRIAGDSSIGRKAALVTAVTMLAAAISVKAYAEPTFGRPFAPPAINDGVKFETSTERQIALERADFKTAVEARADEKAVQAQDRAFNDKYSDR